jgi:hypothetical protein
MVPVLALLSLSPKFAQTLPAGWTKTVLTTEFTVYLPPGAKPDADNKKQPADYKTWIFSSGATVFQVALVPNYGKTEPGLSPDEVVAEFLSGILEESKKATIKRQRDITLNGWPGLEDLLALEMKEGGTFATLQRAYAVSGSLYSVSVMYAPELGRPSDAEPFLNTVDIAAAAKAGPLTTPGPTFSTFAPKGGGFSIGMPAKTESEELPLGKGDQKSVIYRYTATYGNRIYVANFVPFPDAAPEMTQDEKNQGMATLVDVVVKGMTAKTTGQAKTIKRGDLEFVTAEFARADGLVGRVEATTAQRRIYVTVMAYPSGHAGSPDIDAFFNSFQLLPPEPKSK